MTAKFEICRTEDGYFARYVAGNGRIAWVTPGLLSRRRNAVEAAQSIARMFHPDAAVIEPHVGYIDVIYVTQTAVRVRMIDVDLRDPSGNVVPPGKRGDA